MSDEDQIDWLFGAAFDAGASSVTVNRSSAGDGFHASIMAFSLRNDGDGRSVSAGAHADGYGPTPIAALRDALGKLSPSLQIGRSGLRRAIRGRPQAYLESTASQLRAPPPDPFETPTLTEAVDTGEVREP